MKSSSLVLKGCGLIAAAVLAPSGFATVLYQQGFDVDTATTAETISAYGFTSSGTTAIAQAGELRLTAIGSQASIDFGAFAGEIVISFDAAIQGTPGSINVGLRAGDNNYIFHPGYPSGAFRIDGPGGHGNTDMDFTPPTGPSRVTISISTTGLASIQIANGTDVFQTSFLDANYMAGTTSFGLSLGGSGTGIFDNLLVSAVPEPATALLSLLGLAALHARVRRERGK